MSRPKFERNTLEAALEIFEQDGLDGLGQAMTILLNEAMRLERQHWLQAAPYERTDERRGYANGYKPKLQRTRLGELELLVPQVRDGGFYPAALERGSRSERTLVLTIAEMYFQGVSTRKVASIIGELGGFAVSASQVSRAAAELDDVLEEWRNRPLGRYPYVFLDGRYEKVRQGGRVIDCAVLWAVGIDLEGKRDVLGVSVALSEAEIHWRRFLESLVGRGLSGVELVTSDDHPGLKAARRAVLPSVPWQRCQFHLQRNARDYVPRKHLRSEVHDAIRAVFNAPTLAEAERLVEASAARFEDEAPRLAEWIRTELPEGLTVFHFPAHHRRRLRTTNAVERCNKEIRRRTRVATIFPDENSCLRLVTAILMETAEQWQTGRRYLTMELD